MRGNRERKLFDGYAVAGHIRPEECDRLIGEVANMKVGLTRVPVLSVSELMFFRFNDKTFALKIANRVTQGMKSQSAPTEESNQDDNNSANCGKNGKSSLSIERILYPPPFEKSLKLDAVKLVSH